MRSIETKWRGKRFRSHLEAMWAVYFECLCIDWVFEPKPFELDDGTPYLPDFLLRNLTGRVNGNLWVEVKGQWDSESRHKVELFSRHKPLYLVDDIPYREDMSRWEGGMAAAAYNDGGPHPYNFETVDGDFFGAFLGVNNLGFPELFGNGDVYLRESWNHVNKLALKTAAMSRFDHGDRPDEDAITHCREMVCAMRFTYETAADEHKRITGGIDADELHRLREMLVELTEIKNRLGLTNIWLEAFDDAHAQASVYVQNKHLEYDIGMLRVASSHDINSGDDESLWYPLSGPTNKDLFSRRRETVEETAERNRWLREYNRRLSK